MSNVQLSTDRERVPVEVHPTTLGFLRNLLMTHPDLQASGIGYSEFITDAIEAFGRGEWQCGRDAQGRER